MLVVSALFGLLRPGDRIPPYRLSMDVDLPGIGRLAPFWRRGLGPVPARGLDPRDVPALADGRARTWDVEAVAPRRPGRSWTLDVLTH